jgi:hypothetical protein
MVAELLSHLPAKTMLLADRGCDADLIRQMVAAQGHLSLHPAQSQLQAADLFQSAPLQGAQPSRALLQQDQTFSQDRHAI